MTDALIKDVRSKLHQVHKGLSDHARGCEGRNYSCDCGYDEEVQELCGKAADMLEQPGDAEPVAWRYEIANIKEADGTYSHWEWKIGAVKPCVPEGAMRNLQGLYLRRPVKPVGTDEMVEPANKAYRENEQHGRAFAMKRALEAALNVSQPGVK